MNKNLCLSTAISLNTEFNEYPSAIFIFVKLAAACGTLLNVSFRKKKSIYSFNSVLKSLNEIKNKRLCYLYRPSKGISVTFSQIFETFLYVVIPPFLLLLRKTNTKIINNI